MIFGVRHCFKAGRSPEPLQPRVVALHSRWVCSKDVNSAQKGGTHAKDEGCLASGCLAGPVSYDSVANESCDFFVLTCSEEILLASTWPDFPPDNERVLQNECCMSAALR